MSDNNKAITTGTDVGRKSKVEANKRLNDMKKNDQEKGIDNSDGIKIMKENVSEVNLNIAKQYKKFGDHCDRVQSRSIFCSSE